MNKIIINLPLVCSKAGEEKEAEMAVDDEVTAANAISQRINMYICM